MYTLHFTNRHPSGALSSPLLQGKGVQREPRAQSPPSRRWGHPMHPQTVGPAHRRRGWGGPAGLQRGALQLVRSPHPHLMGEPGQDPAHSPIPSWTHSRGPPSGRGDRVPIVVAVGVTQRQRQGQAGLPSQLLLLQAALWGPGLEEVGDVANLGEGRSRWSGGRGPGRECAGAGRAPGGETGAGGQEGQGRGVKPRSSQ